MRSVALGLAVFIPLCCSGEQSCHWINAATAAGILGGAVETTVTDPASHKDREICDFVRQKSPANRLRIEVSALASSWSAFAASSCSSHQTPLRGIGNEAVSCEMTVRGEIAEKVVGRVRNQAFVIELSTDDHSAKQPTLLEKACIAAEQVAGNLF